VLRDSRVCSHRDDSVPHEAAFGLPNAVNSLLFRVTGDIQPVAQVVSVLQIKSVFLGHDEVSFLSWLKIDISG